MKRFRKAVALVLCAAALCGSLAGCAKWREAIGGAKRKTPLELLSTALDATRADLEARFDASLLAGLSGMKSEDAVTANVDVSFPDEAGEVLGSLAGEIVFSSATGEAKANLTISTDNAPLDVYYGPEFLGLSCEKLFGDESFYGLRPYGFEEQLSGSALAELIHLDMDAVRELDRILSSVPRDVNVFTAPEAEQILKATHELIGKLELTVAETTLTRGGEQLKGDEIRAVLSADELADYLEKLSSVCPEWVLVYGLGTGDESAAAVDEALEAIRQSGAETSVTFTVANGKLYHIQARYQGASGATNVEAELYGDNGSTLLLTAEPGFSLSLDLQNGTNMELDASDGSSAGLIWDRTGEFEFLSCREDVTELCLQGTLTAGDGRINFDGVWYSGERGDRNPLTLAISPGGQIAAPEVTRNIAELDAHELDAALMEAAYNLFG